MTKEMITVNGRAYKAKELDFNFLCILGEQGINITDISKKILPTIRAYLAYCMDVEPDIAGNELNAHVINGGSFEDITDVFNQKAEESDFFRALESKKEQKANPKRNTKKNEAEA